MGKKDFYHFHYDFAKNFAQYFSFSPKLRCSIVGGTRDHLENCLCQRGNLMIFYLFYGLVLVFIGNFQGFGFVLGKKLAPDNSRNLSIWDLRESRILTGGLKGTYKNLSLC